MKLMSLALVVALLVSGEAKEPSKSPTPARTTPTRTPEPTRRTPTRTPEPTRTPAPTRTPEPTRLPTVPGTKPGNDKNTNERKCGGWNKTSSNADKQGYYGW